MDCLKLIATLSEANAKLASEYGMALKEIELHKRESEARRRDTLHYEKLYNAALNRIDSLHLEEERLQSDLNYWKETATKLIEAPYAFFEGAESKGRKSSR